MIDEKDLDSMSIQELIRLYAAIINSAKNRNIIRTRNFIGEIGEALVIDYYNSTPNLPTLSPAPVGTRNIDAISIDGERYSIKTASGRVTGSFYGLQPQGSIEPDTQQFEYVVVYSLTDDYELKGIYEITWETFLRHKRWQSRVRAWNLPINKTVINDSRIVYQAP